VSEPTCLGSCFPLARAPPPRDTAAGGPDAADVRHLPKKRRLLPTRRPAPEDGRRLRAVAEHRAHRAAAEGKPPALPDREESQSERGARREARELAASEPVAVHLRVAPPAVRRFIQRIQNYNF